jgi:hypothetical protein
MGLLYLVYDMIYDTYMIYIMCNIRKACNVLREVILTQYQTGTKPGDIRKEKESTMCSEKCSGVESEEWQRHA